MESEQHKEEYSDPMEIGLNVIVTPGGIREGRTDSGQIVFRKHQDGTRDQYWYGKLNRRLFPDGSYQTFADDGSSMGHYDESGRKIEKEGSEDDSEEDDEDFDDDEDIPNGAVPHKKRNKALRNLFLAVGLTAAAGGGLYTALENSERHIQKDKTKITEKTRPSHPLTAEEQRMAKVRAFGYTESVADGKKVWISNTYNIDGEVTKIYPDGKMKFFNKAGKLMNTLQIHKDEQKEWTDLGFEITISDKDEAERLKKEIEEKMHKEK
jgi:hypothetical protein